MGREALDITAPASLRRAFATAAPRFVINCAAITDLSLCELDPVAARRVNVDGVANLAAAAEAAGALLIHMSSDYAAEPVNEYGRSKRDSEAFGHLTIRAKIYDATHWAWQALRDRRRVQMTVTEFCNPISVTGLAALLPRLLQKRLRGVTSLGTADRLSLFEVGRAWSAALGVAQELVEPIGAVASPYMRPSDTFMPIEALVDAGIEVPSLSTDAMNHLKAYAVYGADD